MLLFAILSISSGQIITRNGKCPEVPLISDFELAKVSVLAFKNRFKRLKTELKAGSILNVEIDFYK